MTETDLADYDIPPGLPPAQRALWVHLARKFDDDYASAVEDLVGAA